VSPALTLAAQQAAFHALVTGAAGAPPAEAFLLGTPAFPAAERAAVYAEMWRWRQVDALRADFPALAALLGDDTFLALCDAYLAACPSDDPDIGRLGRRLPAFLRDHPEAAARPDLADLAALEWARLEAFFAAPGTGAPAPLGRAALSTVAPEDFPALRLALVPSAVRLDLDHAVAGLFEAAIDPTVAHAPAPSAGPERLLVWRQGFEVVHTVLAPDEAAALDAVAAGATLGEALGAFAAQVDPAGAALRALGSWLDEGLVAETASGA
jgi:hypothetical protein